MTPTAGLYSGTVWHHRTSPKDHKLAYKCWFLFLDLDNLPNTVGMILGCDRSGVMQFKTSDHANGTNSPLKEQIITQVKQTTGNDAIAHIYILTTPRFLGYIFNPLSIYYCYDEEMKLCALVYEVNNTFRERHNYIVDINQADPANQESQHQTEKLFYVSPFMDTSGKYDFTITPPHETLSITIDSDDQKGNHLKAGFTGTWSPINKASLWKQFFKSPFMSLKIIAAIHYEALKLWVKGISFYRHTHAHPYGSSPAFGKHFSPLNEAAKKSETGHKP